MFGIHACLHRTSGQHQYDSFPVSKGSSTYIMLTSAHCSLPFWLITVLQSPAQNVSSVCWWQSWDSSVTVMSQHTGRQWTSSHSERETIISHLIWIRAKRWFVNFRKGLPLLINAMTVGKVKSFNSLVHTCQRIAPAHSTPHILHFKHLSVNKFWILIY